MGDSLLVSQPQALFGVRGTMRADELARDLIFALFNGNASASPSGHSEQ
jgi:hypothetical protein